MKHSDKHDCCQGQHGHGHGCCQAKHDECDFDFAASLQKFATQAKEQAAEYQERYQAQSPETKRAIKKGLAIGGGVLGGLWLLKKLFGKKD